MALACTVLDGNADAVEFCPTSPFYHILAAATYTLHEGPQPSRAGSLSIFSVEEDGQRLQQLQHFAMPGIFDIKWRPVETKLVPCLAQACADGSLSLYGSDEVQVHNAFNLRELARERISSSMCLSLDWDPHTNNQISVSHSDGLISVVDLGQSHMQVGQNGQAHGFEAWSVTYDSWRPKILYSGGDDCHFCGWDLREGFGQPTFRQKKIHQMGICSVQTNPHWEHVLATGSYDENLRLWDLRMLERPVLTRVLGLGGGVWRLKWNPLDKGLLLAACMHNGFMIVNVQEDEVIIFKEYKGHESLAYGADWFKGPRTGSLSTHTSVLENHPGIHQVADIDGQNLRSRFNLEHTNRDCMVGSSSFSEKESGGEHDKKRKLLVATCSFYDRALHVWETGWL